MRNLKRLLEYQTLEVDRGRQGYQFLKSLVNCLYCTAYLPGL